MFLLHSKNLFPANNGQREGKYNDHHVSFLLFRFYSCSPDSPSNHNDDDGLPGRTAIPFLNFLISYSCPDLKEDDDDEVF